jgi:uncharacterized membrane protein (TIGR02234 family)
VTDNAHRRVTDNPPNVAGRNPAGRAGRRELTAAALGCLLASGLVLVAVGRPWVRFTVGTATGLDVRSTATGHDLAAASSALALVVLAGVVALPATRRVSRVIVGGLMVLAGAGIVVATQTSAVDPSAAVASRAGQVAGLHGAKAADVAASGWPWVVLTGGLLAVVVGVVTVVRSRRWPSMGRRYETGRTSRPESSGEASMWDRLDEGDDPTV